MLRKSLKRIVLYIFLPAFFAMAYLAPVSAQTVTQSYGADTVLQRGMIVMLNPQDGTKVEPLSANSINSMHGVVVNANDTPITISSPGQKVFVATVGRYDVLVSNQNGQIKSGDYVTVSSVSGIGMKADDTQSLVLGKALANFDGVTGVTSAANVKTDNGKQKQVAIGYVPVDISIGSNPLERSASNVPEFLKKASESIADKQVSPFKAYLSAIIFVATAFITAGVLYAGIRNSLIAIGRNPLSRKSVSRGLAQVILVSVVIFLSGLFGVYLLLKL